MLFCAIAGVKSYVLSWEKWNVVIFKKASDTHVSLPIFLLYALEYSLLVVSMIGDVFKEKSCLLDPSSV
jgi:hypothetical protein